MVSSCTYFSDVTIPQPTGPRGQPICSREPRIFEKPYSIVWKATERLMRGKQALPAIVDRNAGLLRFVLQDGTNVTIFLQPIDINRTKVYVRRSRGALTPVCESAILDEIGARIASQTR